MIEFAFSLALILLGLPVCMFVLECVLGVLPSAAPDQDSDQTSAKDIRATVLMPAHNEGDIINETLARIKPQLGPADTVLVVADNCSDSTAQQVRDAGFSVIERHHESERGKGYALAHGVTHIKTQDTPPDVVIIFDADCIAEPDALAKLKLAAVQRHRPVQACYLMRRGTIERITVKVSEFAFLVKNKIRLRGLARMGMPVPLTGTGMAFPWDIIADAQLANGDIVEDMRLGVELAEHNQGATYCDEALVFSYFPTNEAAEQTQRERWEHGHLNTLRQFVPRLLTHAFVKGSTPALAMAVDLMIPPLSLLVMIIGAAWGFFLLWGIVFSQWLFFQLSQQYLMILALVIGVVWFAHGRHILTAKEMLQIPIYVISKISVYVGYIIRKQTKWIRTERR